MTNIPNSVFDYVGLFCDFARKRYYSNNTVRSYINDLSLLEQFDSNFNESSDGEGFIDFLSLRGNASTSMKRTLATCRSFFKFLSKSGVADKNPFDDITLPRSGTKLPTVATNEQVENLLSVISGESFLARRDRCLIALLAGTGARITEILELRLSNINIPQKEIKVLAKGNEERILIVTSRGLKYLQEYLLARSELATSDYSDVLFFNINGDLLTYQAALWSVNKYCKILGIDLTPHSFRHYFLTEILKKTNNIRVCQEIAGHKDVNTTLRYLHLFNKDLHSAVEETFD